MKVNEQRGSTQRVRSLLQLLYDRGLSNRSSEWFTDDMLPDIVEKMAKDHSAKYVESIPIIERKAEAFKAMLEAMVNEENSKKTRTYEIKPGELIVGVMPLGSLGLGKMFPNYLTKEERDVAFFSARGVESVLAHNVPDFMRVVKYGLRKIMTACDEYLEEHQERLEKQLVDHMHPFNPVVKKISFYKSVKICCEAVVAYANTFAELAAKEASKCKDPVRKAELEKIAEICRKVPLEPAETFYEALHSIYIVHLVFHSTVSHLSLGRLDQILQPYLEKSLADGEINEEQALELLECFLIKCAERLNMTLEYAVEQDHQDFASGMGHSPFFVDQEGSVNQFMQNIVIGGLTPDGKDATNRCTYLFLDAFKSIGLPTPVLNLRFHPDCPNDLVDKAADCALNGNCGLPVIYNDESIIPALDQSPKIPLEEARDYAVDGCWEVCLNAKGDFTYNLINLLAIMESSLNAGALLTSTSAQLRGRKMSFFTPPAEELDTFEKFKDAFRKHLRLFTKKAEMEIYFDYCLEGSVTPVPFFSALLGNCFEKGLDKTWGGADYNLAGVVFIAAPNVANSLAAIKELVYEKKIYTLSEVREALRYNFEENSKMEADLVKKLPKMEADFKQAAKFGNNDPAADIEMAWLMDELHEAVVEAEKLSDKIFLSDPEDPAEAKQIYSLRGMTGHPGKSFKKRYGDNFNIVFGAGCGTFELYAHFGIGCAASADGRKRDMPVAPNCSPTSGTAKNGVGGILESYSKLGLDRFGTGVMLDVCLEKRDSNVEYVSEVIRKFLECKGSIMSLSAVDHKDLKYIHDLCCKVREGEEDPHVLDEYADISVRVAGWNSPFVTLSTVQQKDYLKRLPV